MPFEAHCKLVWVQELCIRRGSEPTAKRGTLGETCGDPLPIEQVCAQQPTNANNVALTAFACRMPLQQLSIDVFCLPGARQQTRTSKFAAVGL